MNNTILNNSSPNYPQAATPNGGVASSTASVAAAPSATGASTDDRVKLTDSALALQQAARPDQGDSIDAKRVEQVRQALTNGSYSVNAGRISERMLAMDRQLGGTGKA